MRSLERGGYVDAGANLRREDVVCVWTTSLGARGFRFSRAATSEKKPPCVVIVPGRRSLVDVSASHGASGDGVISCAPRVRL